MAHRKRRGVIPPAPLPPRKPRRDAHVIDNANRLRMDCACDSCPERFNVDYEVLRKEGEIGVTCPYCNREMLVQYVEYAVAMVI